MQRSAVARCTRHAALRSRPATEASSKRRATTGASPGTAIIDPPRGADPGGGSAGRALHPSQRPDCRASWRRSTVEPQLKRRALLHDGQRAPGPGPGRHALDDPDRLRPVGEPAGHRPLRHPKPSCGPSSTMSGQKRAARDTPTVLVRMLDAIIDRLADEIEDLAKASEKDFVAHLPAASRRAAHSRRTAYGAADVGRARAQPAEQNPYSAVSTLRMLSSCARRQECRREERGGPLPSRRSSAHRPPARSASDSSSPVGQPPVLAGRLDWADQHRAERRETLFLGCAACFSRRRLSRAYSAEFEYGRDSSGGLAIPPR